MRKETSVVIDYSQRYAAYIASINTMPKVMRIPFMKRENALNENSVSSQAHSGLLSVALGNVEWDVVLKAMEAYEI